MRAMNRELVMFVLDLALSVLWRIHFTIIANASLLPPASYRQWLDLSRSVALV